MRPATLLPIVLLTGCGDIQKLLDLKDTFDAYTNSTVASTSVLGVAPSDDERVDMALALTELGSGVRASAWLVQSEGAGGLDDDGMTGQPVRIIVDGQGFGMEEVAAGEYVADGDDGMSYLPQTEAELRFQTDEGAKGLVVGLPHAPDFEVPAEHLPKEPLEVDLTGQDYDASLVMVIDVLTGAVTYEQTPSGAMELYEFARADAAVGWIDIPADAFPEESVYAVGIAGTWNAEPETFEGVNVALTTGFAGRFRFATTCTFADETMCDAEPELPELDE
jgi:hypothetical protein